MPRCGSRSPCDQQNDLDETPSKIHVNHRFAPRWNDELHKPENEQDGGLMQFQLQVQQKKKSEEALEDGEENFVALKLRENERLHLAGADDEENRNHRGENAPLIDVGRHHVHQRDVGGRYFSGPIKSAQL